MAKNVHTFDDNNWENEVMKATGPVLVDFYATWCQPCKMLTPIVEKLADEYEGKLKVGKVDVQAAPKVAAKYGISSVPTIIVFEGGQQKAIQKGLVKRDKLVQMAGI